MESVVQLPARRSGLALLVTALAVAGWSSPGEARPGEVRRFARPVYSNAPSTALRPLRARRGMERFAAPGQPALRFRRLDRRAGWYPDPVASERSPQPRPDRTQSGSGTSSLLTAKPGSLVLLPARGLPGPVSNLQDADGPRLAGSVPSPDGSARKPAPGESRAGAEDLPIAEPVAGKQGYARLSGKFSGFPDIDVRGLASGTLVEIADPDTAGKKIRFRVP